MPKKTFFNLSDEKRKKIENVSIDEFSKYGYDKSNVSRIVTNCDIAKGSFYQYFSNKKDLFKFIMERAVEEKLKFLSPVLKNPMEYDFFTLIREMYISGLKYAWANPKLVLIGNQVLKNKNHPVYVEAIGDNMNKSYAIFEELLNLAISKGEVRKDIDIKYVSYIISSMNLATVEYYFENYCNDKDELSKWDEDIMDSVNIFIDFIKNGIGYK